MTGPLINEACNPFIEVALDAHFCSQKKWHFFHTTDRAEKLKFHHISEVVELIGSEKLCVPVAL